MKYLYVNVGEDATKKSDPRGKENNSESIFLKPSIWRYFLGSI